LRGGRACFWEVSGFCGRHDYVCTGVWECFSLLIPFSLALFQTTVVSLLYIHLIMMLSPDTGLSLSVQIIVTVHVLIFDCST
jgi:hypothetical protein